MSGRAKGATGGAEQAVVLGEHPPHVTGLTASCPSSAVTPNEVTPNEVSGTPWL